MTFSVANVRACVCGVHNMKCTLSDTAFEYKSANMRAGERPEKASSYVVLGAAGCRAIYSVYIWSGSVFFSLDPISVCVRSMHKTIELLLLMKAVVTLILLIVSRLLSEAYSVAVVVALLHARFSVYSLHFRHPSRCEMLCER